MRLLMYFMMAGDVHGKVRSEIVRYPIDIPVGIQGPQGARIAEYPDGQGNRPACAVGGVEREAEPVIDPVVADKGDVIGLVVVGRVIICAIDQLARGGCV